MDKENESKNEILVVPELPQVSTRVFEGEDGKTYDLITLTEAVKEILEHVRTIKKSVA